MNVFSKSNKPIQVVNTEQGKMLLLYLSKH